MANNSKFSVKVTDSDISIKYDHNEVLYWSIEEWEEDPSITTAIANAIVMALDKPEKMIEFCRKKNLLLK